MTNSLADNLYTLGTTMATNLVEMGVSDADPDDGLTTLAGKILDIEPSISGLDLDTAVTLTASSASIQVGQSVVLTSKLTASYDDETLVNVDLSGVLTGATILFKEGNTQLGSGVTDSTGVATATISGLTLGSHTIKAVFAGTENFDNCESTAVTVVVSNPTPDSMTLEKTAGKQILSYTDVSGGDEYCTVTATVLDANSNPLAGETVDFKIGSTTVKSDVTDSNGEITYTYNSQGSGDVTITAECSLVSETYSIQDLKYYDVLTSNKGHWTIPSGANVTFDSTNGMVLGASSSWRDVYLEVPITKPCEIEYDIVSWTGTNSYHLYLWDSTKTSRLFHMYKTDGGKTAFDTYPNYDNQWNSTISNGSTVKIKVLSDKLELYVNGDLKVSKTYNMASPLIIGVATASNRTTTYKNLKIKEL